jgi:NosR/NirI family transcriptional regulator, nitrous oxide reductase regulator
MRQPLPDLRQPCPVQAIHPTGEINPNECVNCLHCQVLYQSNEMPGRHQEAEAREASGRCPPRDLTGHPNQPKPQPAE